MTEFVMKAEQPFAPDTELLVDESVIGDELTLKQEAFCRNYTQIRGLFGNATLSYAEAYNIDISEPEQEEDEDEDMDDEDLDDEDYSPKKKKGKKAKVRNPMYDHCASSGSRLLRNVKINKRITELLNEYLTDSEVDAVLAEIIKGGYKDADRVNAIKEYNKLRQRIVEKKDITSGGEKIAGFNFIRADEPVKEEGHLSNAGTNALPEPTFVRLPTINLNEQNTNGGE